MVVGAELCCYGVRLENGRFSDLTYCKKLRSKFTWWERTYGLCSQDRRAILTIGKENWVLKLEIEYTSRCHLWEVYHISRYEASSHLESLVSLRSWGRERRRIEGRVSKFLFWSIRISGMRFILRGRFVTPQNLKDVIKNSLKFKTFLKR
jgi:hypothetical protein